VVRRTLLTVTDLDEHRLYQAARANMLRRPSRNAESDAAFTFGHRDGTVEAHHGRGENDEEPVVAHRAPPATPRAIA
jgi:hypothetical protein